MKTIRFVRIAALLIALFAVTSQALAAPHGYDSPRAAADGTRRVAQFTHDLLDDGYTRKSVHEQPIYYFAPPQAPYLWGNIVFTYSRPVDALGLHVDYVEITVTIRYTDDGFKVASMSTREFTNN
jgi:hypothetical protein